MFEYAEGLLPRYCADSETVGALYRTMALTLARAALAAQVRAAISGRLIRAWSSPACPSAGGGRRGVLRVEGEHGSWRKAQCHDQRFAGLLGAALGRQQLLQRLPQLA
ncbi:MAG: hypothetical protein EB084_13950, partial [Proteobacteria bacterium]|nr:hypothetical protein [Pseudomonadota bacterium]